MVADYLRALTDDDAGFARLEALQRDVLARLTAFAGSDRLARDEAHARAIR